MWEEEVEVFVAQDQDLEVEALVALEEVLVLENWEGLLGLPLPSLHSSSQGLAVFFDVGTRQRGLQPGEAEGW